MKKTLLTLLAVLLLTATRVSAQGPTLVLHHSDGKTSEVELYTMPSIQLLPSKMVITAQGSTLEYAKSDVVRFTYKGVNTGISDIRPEARYRVDTDRITFFGISASDRIEVYNAGGIRIPVTLANEGNDAVLSLTQLPQGVYLVNINGRTFKFIKP